MSLRMTIYLLATGGVEGTQVVEVQVHERAELSGASPQGFFVEGMNWLILSPVLYYDFATLNSDQAKQARFVDGLKRIRIEPRDLTLDMEKLLGPPRETDTPHGYKRRRNLAILQDIYNSQKQ